MLDPNKGTAFTPLATLQLPGPHVLHPQACNPTMDLVVLLAQGSSVKGKAKVGLGGITKLALWRMSGSRVWEIDVEGQVKGLVWSHDGTFIHLSVGVMLICRVVPDGPNFKTGRRTHLSGNETRTLLSTYRRTSEIDEARYTRVWTKCLRNMVGFTLDGKCGRLA